MKFAPPVLLAIASVSQASGLCAQANEIQARAAAGACGDPRLAIPLLRAYNNRLADHFYTTNSAELQNAVSRQGYTAEGTTGYVFSKQQPGTVALHRLYSAGAADHFYTTSTVERDNAVARLGYKSEGAVGYAYTSGGCGGLPFHRSYSAAGTDHFYTMSTTEKDNAAKSGWAYEGVAGYMLPY